MAGAMLVLTTACDADLPSASTPEVEDQGNEPLECSIPASEIYGGGPRKDGIPAITDPKWVSWGDAGAEYLEPDDRVVGFMVDGQPYAIPLNILWWHEIVNVNLGDHPFSVTHCPLTGSSLAFDRVAADGAEFGVSGMLYQNNLIMYDRNDVESLWPQMLAGARCGVRDGTPLPMVPIIEMEWEGWTAVNPNTLVMPNVTGWDRNYTVYPYGDYNELNNSSTFFPQDVDTRRPPKERALGVATEVGTTVFPYGVMDQLGELVVLRETVGGTDMVVFWSREAQGAAAFHTALDGEPLSFTVQEGRIVDQESGSTWRMDGLGLEGPRAGERLVPVAEAYVAFWFAWATFHPELRIWGSGSDSGPGRHGGA